ncbi:MAG TPA: endonuclease III [Candidatus Saccharimonadales bacterium]|nr:endonuclease III [Candidatus Saccharimonadales bacterium]
MNLDREKPRALRILRGLKKLFPEAPCALGYSNPLELLVATVLSAQCTDARVNIVTKALFRKYRTAADYAASPPGVLEDEIRSTGFFKNKARAIRGLAGAIAEKHGGEVPSSMEALVALPGVGRKTANVVLGEGFGITSGIVVDTHVHRLSRRLGLTAEDDPVKIEKDLMALFPRKEWVDLGMRLILHGRGLCTARKPKCAECPLLPECPFGRREARGSAPARAAKRRAPQGNAKKLTRARGSG